MKKLGVALLITIFGFTVFFVKYFFSPLQIKMQDVSMSPTIPVGSVVRFERAKNLSRGDVIVYKSKNGLVISRIAGMPSEHVLLFDEGIVIDFKLVYGFRDLKERAAGRAQGKEISGKKISKYEKNLSFNQFLVICDNEEIPVTGRVGGPIHLNQIIGRLIK